MAKLPAEIPILLCPLRIETRFVNNALWIRVFPDDFLLESHNTQLTLAEVNSAKKFKQNISLEDKKTGWQSLVAQYGAYRAAYLVHLTDQEITNKTQSATEENSGQIFCFRSLPARLSFFLYEKKSSKPFKDAQGKIPTGNAIPQEGLIALGKDDEWLSDFELAIEKGMGIKIPFGTKTITEFDRIIVTGFQATDSPEDGAENLTRLIKNHQYHDGFSIIEYGTPTNNFESLKSGNSSNDEFDSEKNFVPFVLGENNLDNPEAAANVLSNALGVELNNFIFLENASLAPPPLNALYQKATWFSMGANTLRLLFGDQISTQQSEQLWEYYSNNVRARGTFPTLKVGDQPYALLPVSSIRNTSNNTSTFLKKIEQILSSMFEEWMNIVRNNDSDKGTVPRMENAEDPFQSLLDILSMQVGTSDLEIQTLGYDRIRGRLQSWLQKEANIPTALSRLPLTQVYELLEGQSETNGFMDSIQTNIEALENALPSGMTKVESTTQSPILTFKEEKNYLLKPNDKTIKITQDDLSILNNILDEVVLKNQTKLVEYSSSDISVFVDLLLRSFVNAQRLYHRVIYYQPTNNQLKGYKHLHINQIKIGKNKKASKGNIVLTIQASKTNELKNDKTISIKTPIGGEVEQLYVKKGDRVEAGHALFRISNKTKHSQIVKKIKNLAEAIIELNLTKEEQLTAIREVHDLNSHRLDAWITGLATQRINNSRKNPTNKTGILMGAYGWVENLKITPPTPLEGGIIHCPSPAQAMTATLFKNSFLSYHDKNKYQEEELGGNPFTLNLTSDRIQKSNWLMQGIREDESVEALLGYRLEKDLHEAELHEAIYILRKYFPLEVNIVNQAEENVEVGFTQLSVINGLKAIAWKEANDKNPNSDELAKLLNKKYPTSQFKKIEAFISNLIDVLDGSLDNLFFEAGYQLAQGNIPRSAAAMQATKGEIAPPETFALKTRLSGTGIQHSLAMLFSSPKKTFQESNAKAFVEPVLETWLMEQFGPMEKIGCTVEVFLKDDFEKNKNGEPLESIPILLSDLNIGYLDFVFLPETDINNGATELETNIVNHIKVFKSQPNENFIYRIIPTPPENCQSLDDALEIKEYILTLWKKSRALNFDDLSNKNEGIQIDTESLEEIKFRLEKIISKLSLYHSNPVVHLKELSQFNIQYAKQSWFYREVPNLEKLKIAIQKKVDTASSFLFQYDSFSFSNVEDYKSAFRLLEKTAKVFFGKSFILLPPVLASTSYTERLQSNNQDFLIGKNKIGNGGIGGQQRVQQWVQELAQVQEEMTAFEDWQMVQNAWQEGVSNLSTGQITNKNKAYKIIQFPTQNNYPWIGLSKIEIEKVISTYPNSFQIYQDPDTAENFPKKEKGKYYPDGSASTVLQTPDDLVFVKENKSIAQYGMIITSFAEHIPDEQVTTGLSFHFNTPNCEAPQALLLATAADKVLEKGFWEIEDLNDILYDTLDLAKVRMVDPETLKKFGFALPMTGWFNIPTVN